MKIICSTAAALLALLVLAGSTRGDDGWRQGRATWFDVGPDISTANCHMSSTPTGRYVGAFPDVQDGFASSCGTCYEVRCRPSTFTDGYGETLQREDACYDPTKTVVLTIADACPCHYPNNAFSNKRWCCGDMLHMDISLEVFEQLANLDIGVIGLDFRQVDCSTTGSPGTGQRYTPNQGSGNTNSNSGSSSGGSSTQQSSGSSRSWWGGSSSGWRSWLNGRS